MEKYLDLRNKKEYKGIEEAGQKIKAGGLVLFPTETVYGLGANGLNSEAVEKIYSAKGRKSDNPLILHISNLEMLSKIAQGITKVEQKLIQAFFPGPFTIILKRTDIVPDVVTAGLETVGIRMPSGEIARRLIEEAGVPIAAPSANISGKPSGTNVQDIYEELKDKVDIIIDGGETEVGLESTVVQVIDEIPHILRPGKITAEQIKEVVGNVEIDKHILNKTEKDQKILSPGMKYRHYAPNSKCLLVYSKEKDKLVNKIKEIANTYDNPLIISKSDNIENFSEFKTIDMGNTLEDISKNIFTVLRKVDKEKPSIVIIEGVSRDGIGLAIMNRLIRACEYNYIEV
ncbi:MAG: threonylcarbamoyl-AMP synthase [Clostridia bacterium]|nr:threonylcarbamoyl-AMP synthase [Clostridia bacterium]